MQKIGALSLSLALLAGLNVVHAGDNVVDFGGLTAKLPDGWKLQDPSNKLRKYQASIAKAEGDKENAELVVFFFGKGGGGGTEDNIKRWKTQFNAPDGKSNDED